MFEKHTKWREPERLHRQRVERFKRTVWKSASRFVLLVATMIGVPAVFLALRAPELEIDWPLAIGAVLTVAALFPLIGMLTLLRMRYVLRDKSIGWEGSSSPLALTPATRCVVSKHEGFEYLLFFVATEERDLIGRRMERYVNRRLAPFPLPNTPAERSEVLDALGERVSQSPPPEFKDLVERFRSDGSVRLEPVCSRERGKESDVPPIDWAITWGYSALIAYVSLKLTLLLPASFFDPRICLLAAAAFGMVLGSGTVLGVWEHGLNVLGTHSRVRRLRRLNASTVLLSIVFWFVWAAVIAIDRLP